MDDVETKTNGTVAMFTSEERGDRNRDEGRHRASELGAGNLSVRQNLSHVDGTGRHVARRTANHIIYQYIIWVCLSWRPVHAAIPPFYIAFEAEGKGRKGIIIGPSLLGKIACRGGIGKGVGTDPVWSASWSATTATASAAAPSHNQPDKH